jgi:hypothetical protein
VLCFLDIPGTGSEGLVPVLEAAYAAAERVWVYEQFGPPGSISNAELRGRPLEERARLRLLMGNLSYGIHGRLLPGRVSYAALLRDPLERIVALHERAARVLPHDRPPLSLERFVFEQQRLDVDNGQVRAIAGRRLVRWGAARADLLAEALDHVERHFAGLMVAELPTLSANALDEAAGRRLEGVAEAIVPPRVDLASIEPTLADRIRTLNELDMRLHDHARSRLLSPK